MSSDPRSFPAFLSPTHSTTRIALETRLGVLRPYARSRYERKTGEGMTKAVLGIIGGSGIYDLPGLENAREEAIASPWGEPSAPVRHGNIAGLPIVFLPRHDKGHRLAP